MKALYFLASLLLFAVRSAAQSISGTVVDENDKPVSGATVSLLSAKDSAWQRSELTGSDGRFSLSHEEGNYLIQATAEGFQWQTKPCILQKGNKATASFRLSPVAKTLDGVTVTIRKPFIEAKPGMMVVNIEGSALSAGNNALELLRRSPGVQVDADGNISLRGKGDVQVYVDGRSLRLSGAQLAAYLQAMTAEEIAQLELMTQPSAKYEAAGTAGIINIRTRTVRRHGTNVALSGTLTRATEWQGAGSARITYRHGKLTLYASDFFRYTDNHSTLRVERRFHDAATGALAGSTLTEQETRWHSRFHRLKAGGEYAVSKATTIGIRAQAPLGAPEGDYHNFTTATDAGTGANSYTLGTRYMSNRWHEAEVGVLARHHFRDDGELSFDGYYCANHGADGGLFYNSPADATGKPLFDADIWDISFPVTIRQTSVQSDYSRPIDKRTKLESGIKYTRVAIDNIAGYRIADGAGALVPDTARSTRFLYNEAVAAAYLSGSRSFGDKLEVQAGLRAEQTGGDGSVPKMGDVFKRNYLSLFPTLFASWKADSSSTFTFSYGRRLDRPEYYMLNPARDYIDKYSYRVGNPHLLPQFNNNAEIGYSWKGKLTATLSAMQTDGIISDFFVQDDKTKTAYEIHDNIAGYRQGGLSLNYNSRIVKGWTLNLYGDFYLKAFSGNYFGIDYTQRGSSCSFNASNQFELGRKWSAELSGWYNGPALNTVFTQSAPIGSVDAAVSKKLLPDSLLIKVAVENIFGTQSYHGENHFANIDTDVRNTWDARRAVISMNYNFGSRIETMQRKGSADN